MDGPRWPWPIQPALKCFLTVFLDTFRTEQANYPDD